jgi:chemotaxis protein CheX
MLSKEDLDKALSESVKSAFSTMLSMDLKEEAQASGMPQAAELICNIGLAGSMEGSITLFFSNAGACAIVAAMLGMEITEVTSDVCDGMCEMANVIAGGVKTKTAHLNCSFNLSLPTAVQGKVMHLSVTDDLSRIIKRFSTDKFFFDVEFIFKIHQAAEAPKAAPAVNKMSAFEKLKAMTAQAKS